jgi:hypothetical protein
MAEDSDSAAADEGVKGEGIEPSPEAAGEIMHDPQRFVSMFREHPEMLDNLAGGYRMLREGLSDFLTANDRGAERVRDTADKLLQSLREELARGGLSPDERYRLIEAEERVLGRVADSETAAQQANERSFTKTALAITATAAVGVAALGYLAKTGKLPPLSPPTV